MKNQGTTAQSHVSTEKRAWPHLIIRNEGPLVSQTLSLGMSQKENGPAFLPSDLNNDPKPSPPHPASSPGNHLNAFLTTVHRRTGGSSYRSLWWPNDFSAEGVAGERRVKALSTLRPPFSPWLFGKRGNGLSFPVNPLLSGSRGRGLKEILRREKRNTRLG